MLLSNRYTPMIHYLADTSGGRHGTLITTCSAQTYRRFGKEEGHSDCESNLHHAL